MSDKPVSLTWIDLLGAVWSARLWALAAAVLGAGAGWVWWRAAPRVYEAEVRLVPAVIGLAPLDEGRKVDEVEDEWARPRFAAATLAEMARSGAVLAAAAELLAGEESLTGEALAGLTRARVSGEGQRPDGYEGVQLAARGPSVATARRRAAAMVSALRGQAESVARRAAEEVNKACAAQLAASDRALEEAARALQRAMEETGLAAAEEEARALEAREADVAARLASLRAARESDEARAEALRAPLSEEEREALRGALAARAGALELLVATGEAERAEASAAGRRELEQALEQLLAPLRVEAAVVAKLWAESANPEAEAARSLVWRELWSRAGSGAGEWPISFSGAALGARSERVELVTRIRAAHAGEVRLGGELAALRRQIGEQESQLAAGRRTVEPVRRRYAVLQRGAEALAERLSAVQAAALPAGEPFEVIADASASGRQVSMRAWQGVRTGAVLGLALALAGIIGRTAARGSRRPIGAAGGG